MLPVGDVTGHFRGRAILPAFVAPVPRMHRHFTADPQSQRKTATHNVQRLGLSTSNDSVFVLSWLWIKIICVPEEVCAVLSGACSLERVIAERLLCALLAVAVKGSFRSLTSFGVERSSLSTIAEGRTSVTIKGSSLRAIF